MRRMTSEGICCGLLLIGSVAVLGGCALRRPNFAIFDPNLTSQGAVPIEDSKLKEILDAHAFPSPTPDADHGLERSFTRFYEYCNTAGRTCRLERNGVQERLIGESEKRCAGYEQFLKQFEVESNFGFGAAVTTLAGLGAVLTPAGTVRALAGAAAIVQGTRAEFSDAFFSKLAAQIIAEGIDAKRNVLLTQIRRRQMEDVGTYPLEAAVAEAITYHGACSTLEGLRFAVQAVKQANLQAATDQELQTDNTARALAAVIAADDRLKKLKIKIDELAKKLGDSPAAELTAAKQDADEAEAAARKLIDEKKPIVEASAKDAVALNTQIRIATDNGHKEELRASFAEAVATAENARVVVEHGVVDVDTKVQAFQKAIDAANAAHS